jgi:phosphoglycerol transferase
LFLFAVLPASVAISSVVAYHDVVQNKTANTADRAAAYALQQVPPGQRKLVTVVGTDLQQMMRIQFHLDESNSALLQLPQDAPVEQYQLPVHNKWLLVLGKHPLPEGLPAVVQNDGYALVHVDIAHRPLGAAALSQPFGHGLIAGAEGLSYAEAWGRWSDAKRVVIRFNQPLPRHLRVVMKVQAYGENTELPFVMHIGGKSERFRVGWYPEEIGLAFETDGTARELAIDVPHPVAPLEHGQPDVRTLGIGITTIEVGEVERGKLAAD